MLSVLAMTVFEAAPKHWTIYNYGEIAILIVFVYFVSGGSLNELWSMVSSIFGHHPAPAPVPAPVPTPPAIITAEPVRTVAYTPPVRPTTPDATVPEMLASIPQGSVVKHQTITEYVGGSKYSQTYETKPGA